MRDTETITKAEQQPALASSLVTYSYNNVNQLESSTNPSRSYSYDADGNMTSWYTPDGYQITDATYDAENRLLSASYTDSHSLQHSCSFEYDAEGFMAKQVVDGVETRFVRDGALCLQERNSSNTVIRSYVWDPTAPGGIGGLLELTQGGRHYNYLYDGKGNVSAVINAAQNVVASYVYDEFGNLKAKTGTLDQPYQFSTKYYYPGLGLNYYGYRFYNPVIGKWMTRDPLGEIADNNLYRTMGNSPVNNIDPLGLLTSVEALAHYLGGSGTPLKMQIDEINTERVFITQFVEVRNALNGNGKCKDQVIDIDTTKPFSTSGDAAATVGSITIRLKGTLYMKCDCSWTFIGNLSALPDKYDFNASTHRSKIGEISTTIGRQLPGKKYTINIEGFKSMYAHGKINGTPTCCEKK